MTWPEVVSVAISSASLVAIVWICARASKG